jgi:hypothetical protein
VFRKIQGFIGLANANNSRGSAARFFEKSPLFTVVRPGAGAKFFEKPHVFSWWTTGVFPFSRKTSGFLRVVTRLCWRWRAGARFGWE